MNNLLLLLTVAVLLWKPLQGYSKDELFLQWFKNNGGKLNGLTVSEFEGMGRGLLANSDIKSDQEVIFVPSSIIFSRANLDILSRKDVVLRSLATAYQEKSEAAMTAWLLLEFKRGIDSFFKPYIDFLPQYVPSLLHFSMEELNELQSPELSADSQNLQYELKADFNKFQRVLKSHWPYPIMQTTLDDYKWAVSIVNSRGLHFRGEVYLSPVTDIFNYSPQKISRDSQGGENFLKYHILGSDGSITVLADRDAVNGEQLFEDYGDNNDDLYLKYHGFVAIGNPFTCVHVDASKAAKILKPLGVAQAQLLRLFEIRMDTNSFKCIDKSAKLGKAMEIYTIVSSFDDAFADHCLSVMRQYPRAWTKILEDCSINIISDYVYKATSSSPTVEWSPNVVATGDKALKVLRNLMSIAIAPLLVTTSDEDRSSLVEIQNSLDECDNIAVDSPSGSTCSSKETYLALTRKMLAIQYRLQKKDLWTYLCERFNHNTCFLTLKKAAEKSTGHKSELEQKIDAFNAWFLASKPSAASITAAYIPGFRVGTVAVEDVKIGRPYLGVPLSIIMDSETAHKNSSVTALISALIQKYNARDDFHELLLFLVYETFVSGPSSPYWPYLFLLPKLSELDIPILWPNNTLADRLGPSHILPEVVRYRQSIQKRFKAFKDISIVANFSPAGIFTWDTYLWATVVLDSRSIWWDGKRHLVPMLDFVNCAEDPTDPSRVHRTDLDDSKRYAITKGGANFKFGQQVFENYGQPNHIYFLYHGFSIQGNSHDCVSWILQLNEEERSAGAFTPTGQDILRQLGLDKAGSEFNSCLKYPVPTSVWLYLAVKMRTVEALKKIRLLGKATPAAAEGLVSMIDERLLIVSTYNSSHAGARAFIESEIAVLRATRASLVAESEQEGGDSDEL